MTAPVPHVVEVARVPDMLPFLPGRAKDLSAPLIFFQILTTLKSKCFGNTDIKFH